MSAVTPSAIIVQMKKKPPLDWAISPPTPFPFRCRTGTSNPSRDARSRMTYPDRRPASASAPYPNTTTRGGGFDFGANAASTSYAAAFVTGAVALLKTAKPNASTEEIRRAIVRGADLVPALQNVVAAGGRLDVDRALRNILIAGPTASGKSALALALAEQYGGTIINADSMQVYRDLRIITARPTAAEEERAPHRLYGHVDAGENFSVGRWCREAAAALAAARREASHAIIVGGTGLYFSALTRGLAAVPPIPARM